MNNETNEAAKYPAARPEIIAEIVAIDCQLADLILKCQRNARELDELAGVLDPHLGTCEFERDSLLFRVPDRSSQPAPPTPTMTDLPADEQRLIFEAAMFGAIGLETLRLLTHADPAFLMDQLLQGVEIAVSDTTEKQITERLNKYLEIHNVNLSEEVFWSIFQEKNN